MSKKTIKYLIATVVFLFLAYHSVYFRKLDEVKAATSGNFDAEAYIENLWNKELMPSLAQAVRLDSLLAQLKAQPEEAFARHSHALGIGNIRYFMVQAEAEVVSRDDNFISVKLANIPQAEFKIATEYIYGNEVRDASNLIPMTEFKNTMDFNNISASINKKIRNEVIPVLKKDAETGKRIRFFGATELNQKYVELNNIEIIPVKVEFL